MCRKTTYSPGEKHIKFIRNIKIQVMVVLILVFSTLAWSRVSGFALWILHELEQQITLNTVQAKWVDMVQFLPGAMFRIAKPA
ncbi:MAG TPA: hypothetical protein VJY31_07495 [Buttiauxella sp.]|nr:hypothetical protein [Buttiauxella sp.]